jgi:hypothetical protein
MYNFSYLLTQKQRNDVIASISDLFIYDAGLTYALTNDAFQICIALSNIARRSISASTLFMNVLYYGSQNLTTVGTLTNVATAKTAKNVGAIVGGVIGGVVGLCLLITVIAILVTLVLIFRRKHVDTKSEVPESLIPLASDIEQPVTPRELVDQVEIELKQEKPLKAEVVEEQLNKQELVVIQSSPAEEDISLAIEKDLGKVSQDMKETLRSMKEAVFNFRKQVAQLTNTQLHELISYKIPPEAVLRVVRAAGIILDYPVNVLQTWDGCRKLLKDQFLRKLANYDPTSVQDAKKFKKVNKELQDLTYELCNQKGSRIAGLVYLFCATSLQVNESATELRKHIANKQKAEMIEQPNEEVQNLATESDIETEQQKEVRDSALQQHSLTESEVVTPQEITYDIVDVQEGNRDSANLN